MNVTIHPQRLLEDLRQLATFGRAGPDDHPGIHRPSLSPQDMTSRHWLVERMTDAGLDARIDGIGNVVGRSKHLGPALLIGSHTDSQPRGGWLDGSLGVVYGLEIVRALHESQPSLNLPIDVVSFIDEEGTFIGCLGSLSFCNQITSLEVGDATNQQTGQPLNEAIAEAGLLGLDLTRLEPDRHMAYLEAHIEQGNILESEGSRIGVVSTIVGIRNFDIRFKGKANHAGTTPMNLREDAGSSLINFAYELNKTLQPIAGPNTVWTIGRVNFDPGATSVIPGHADLTLQFRDSALEVLDRFERQVEELVATANRTGPVHVSLHPSSAIKPSAMDKNLQNHLAAAAQIHAPGAWKRMPSAAGHDAMTMADQLPCAMLFVPSIGGISHDYAEDTKEADIILGCEILATAAASILQSTSRLKR